MAQGGSRELSLAGLAAIILALLSPLLWKAVSLDVPRQPPGNPARSVQATLQDIDARLWEDPFAAVNRARLAAEGDAARAGTHTLDGLCRVLGAPGPRPRRVLVLGVLLSSSPYADGEEARSRVRYALQSAFSVSHFVPDDAQRLGYFGWQGKANAFGEQRVSVAVPFELFRRTNQSTIGYELQALVMWLEEEWFARRTQSPAAPLAQVRALAADLAAYCGRAGLPVDNLEVAILGPATSDTLRAMVREVRALPRAATGQAVAHPRLQWYSPAATASENTMLEVGRTADAAQPSRAAGELPCRTAGAAGLLQALFKERGIGFTRTIATDDDLACELAEELARRRVHLLPGPAGGQHVALVSEWDTYYGRMLPEALLAAVGLEQACETDPSERVAQAPGAAQEPSAAQEPNAAQDPGAAQAPGAAETQGCPVLRFNYLRGLNELPLGATAAKTEPSGGGKDDVPTEAAEGYKQLDYLRRLAGRILREDRRLRAEGRGEIAAIGVLGSDVYDKISVLRALRAEFPRAVFFTTDLDARLLSPRQYDWTRNLVVASSFGLELAPCLQRGVPPFRNVYQTSAFFAARLALYNAFPEWRSRDRPELCPEFDGRPARLAERACPALTDQTALEALRKPQLFELGRTRAVALDAPRSSCPDLCSCQSIQPPAAPAQASFATIGWSLLALTLLVTGLLLMDSVRRLPADAWKFLRGLPPDPGHESYLWSRSLFCAGLLMLVLIVTVALGRALYESLTGGGEPLLLLEGVSVWPTELVRYAAFLLSILFLVSAMQRVRESDLQIRNQFAIGPAGAGLRLRDILLGRFEGMLHADGSVDIARLWSQYRVLGAWYTGLLRAGVFVIAFMLLSQSLFRLFGYPNVPVRGEWAFLLDRSVTFLSVILFLWLLFYVNDAIRLCDRFIRVLTQDTGPTAWPEPAVRAAQRTLGLGRLEDMTELRRIVEPWLDMDVIRHRTLAISPLIYLPFVILALLIVSRWPMFDDWHTPLSLALVFGLAFVAACVNAFLLQQTAGRAREACLGQLEAVYAETRAQRADDRVTQQQIEAMMARVRNLREGAFRPFLEQPLTRAALLPFGSVGVLQVVDLLTQAAG